jgi:hypothetical protein
MVLPYNKLLMACLTVIPGGCDYPPYNCSVDVDTSCVENFTYVTSTPPFMGEALTLVGYYSSDEPFNEYVNETTEFANYDRAYITQPLGITATVIDIESLQSYTYYLYSEVKWDAVILITRDSAGEVNKVSILYYEYDINSGKSIYEVGDVITIPGGWVGGEDDIDDIIINFVEGSVAEYKVGAWENCADLDTFPILDTSNGVDFSYAWKENTGLTQFPLLDTSNGLSFEGAWYSCIFLSTFPLLDVGVGTNFYRSWQKCFSLSEFPNLNVSNGINFRYTWSDTGIVTFPSLNFSSGLDFYSSWENCLNLTDFPSSMFDDCAATNFEFAWTNCGLSTASVNNILISLDTAGQSNGKVSLDDGSSYAPTGSGIIAKDNLISKGWIVSTN